MVLDSDFYQRNNVATIARELLGKSLVTNIDGELTSGVITETEAYHGVIDKASHAYGGRFTNRTEVMYRSGGVAYVYLCYGIHSLFNVVTNRQGIPHAVLIRSIVPENGFELMLARVNKEKITKDTGIGPGKVSKLLGINYKFTGQPLTHEFNGHLPRNENRIWIEDRSEIPKKSEINITPRIGVDYAGDDALWDLRKIYKKKPMK